MGNRAVIATKEKDIGIYVHWHGGRDSIDAFLAYCRAMHYRAPSEDDYGWACLTQTIRNWFGRDGLSVGIGKYENLDTNNYDNGVYIIDGWKVVGREFNYDSKDEESTVEGLTSFLRELNSRQPEKSQLKDEVLEQAARDYLAQYEETEEKQEDKTE